MHPNSNELNVWPAKYGHPHAYFEALLEEASDEAYSFGRQMGAYCAVFCGGLTLLASKLPAQSLSNHGFSKQVMGNTYSGIRSYHVALVTIMSGLLSSQLATHYSYQLAHDRITEQRRREAFFRAEARKRGEL